MNQERFNANRLRRSVETLAYVAVQVAVLVGSAWIVLGLTGALWIVAGTAVAFLFQGQLPVATVLRLRGARPLTFRQAPALFHIVDQLALRAELPRAPRLFRVPRVQPEAFTLASGDDAAIAVSDGMLRLLTPEELAGVLAHEVSHVRARDTQLLLVVHALRQITGSVVMLGFGVVLFAWAGLFTHLSPLLPLLLLAPGLSLAITLAVSRTREFDADLGAAALLGDPIPLARALIKLDGLERRWLGSLGVLLDVPHALRTHPRTAQRVERLLDLSPRSRPPGRPDSLPPVGSRPKVRALLPTHLVHHHSWDRGV